MVKVSTLFYVLEDLGSKNEELIDLDEIHELEQKYMNGLFGIIDRARLTVRPEVIKHILQTTSTE